MSNYLTCAFVLFPLSAFQYVTGQCWGRLGSECEPYYPAVLLYVVVRRQFHQSDVPNSLNDIPNLVYARL